MLDLGYKDAGPCPFSFPEPLGFISNDRAHDQNKQEALGTRNVRKNVSKRIFGLLHVIRAFVCSIELKIKKMRSQNMCGFRHPPLDNDCEGFKFINLLSLSG